MPERVDPATAEAAEAFIVDATTNDVTERTEERRAGARKEVTAAEAHRSGNSAMASDTRLETADFAQNAGDCA